MHSLSLKTVFISLIIFIILAAVFFLQIEDVTSHPEVAGKTRNIGNVTPPSCTPKTNIMYLKTHKTASTTVQNLVLRVADSRNLTLAIPKNKKRFQPEKMFSTKYVYKYNNESSFNVIAHHLRFNPGELHKVLKAKDTVYFTIIRHPVSQMESAFSYFRHVFSAFSRAKSLDDFLKNGNRYYSPTTKWGNNWLVKNPLWFEFGNSRTFKYTEDGFARAVQRIERSFHLILIVEHFDESMILLKETMCWDIDDVIAFNHNSRGKKDHKNISEDVAKGILEWNSLDWRLYQHFNKTFWAKIEKMFSPARLQEELAILRERRKFVEKQCCEDGLFRVKKPGTKGAYFKSFLHMTYHKVRSDLDKDFKLKCEKYFRHENEYTRYFYNKQYRNVSSQ